MLNERSVEVVLVNDIPFPATSHAAFERQHVVVMTTQRLAMRHGEQRDAQCFARLVQRVFHVARHGTRALVENGKRRSMVEEAAERHALFLTAGKARVPVAHFAERPLFQDEAGGIDDREERFEVRVGHAALHHLLDRVRIDELVAQRAEHEVRLLRQEENARLGRFGEHARLQRPQLANHAEQRTLATAVRSGHHDVDATLHATRQVLDEQLAVGRHQVDRVELDVVANHDGAAVRHLHAVHVDRLGRPFVAAPLPLGQHALELGVTRLAQRTLFGTRRRLAVLRHILTRAVFANHKRLRTSFFQSIDHFQQFADTCCVTSNVDQFVARQNQIADRHRQTGEVLTRADVVARQISRGARCHLSGARIGNGVHQCQITDNTRPVFNQQLIKAANQKAQESCASNMTYQIIQCFRNNGTFFGSTIIKCNFFR
mmetsp:Transcript_3257/g.5229  ORF Transcript_3257/g.5229 Transcript_3257/m.5229 type:complete len:431 (-) Transcript_3257:871-2163(-)